MAVLEISVEQIVRLLDQLTPEQRDRVLMHLSGPPMPLPAPKRRRFGRGKGAILHMAADFDAPLDDFEAYTK